MAGHKLAYARSDTKNAGHLTLIDVVKAFKPTCMLGLSTIAKSFNKELLSTVTSQVEQPPIVLALSNPTIKCECTSQECYDFTGGKGLYASGSPMPLVKKTDGTEVESAQCNNFYCFPGIGFGTHFCGATEITDMMIVAVSNAIADMMS